MAETQETQEHNEIGLIVDHLDEEVLLLLDLSIEEEIGRLFTIYVELIATENIIFEDFLGKSVSIRLNLPEGMRFFNGHVSSISQTVDEGSYARYNVTIRPWFWFLTRTSDCRIFQNLTVPDIIKEVCNGLGFTDIDDKLTATYRTLEYCVQYRETDFNFLSRLMEKEGIYYYFTHEKGKHTLNLADSYSSHELITGYEEIPYNPADNIVEPDDKRITSWFLSKKIQPGACVLDEYDFKLPKADLKVNSNIVRTHSEAEHEVFDYPGEYVASSDGDTYARIRIEELHTQYEQGQGQSIARGLMSGGLFALTDYTPREDQSREYLIVSVNHSIRMHDFEAVSDGGGAAPYLNSFTVVESSTPYRPASITPKPIVQGPQTAVVVGPAGEEIYTNEYGQVKLQFHWDRYGQSDENSSCWVRVSQLWAGKTWGGIHIPRIGQEVIVEFLEGDPDRPIVTGRVYNGDQTPPYDLPANKTQSGIKSRSSMGGSGANFNELRFEDKLGEEEVYIHAEKDQNNIVENDETTSVGNDRTEDVGNDEKITIGNNRSEQVVNDETIDIGMNRTETVGVDESIAIGANRTKTVGASETVSVTLQRTHTVGVNETIGIGGAQEIGIGVFQAVVVGAYQTINVGTHQNTNVALDQSTNVGGDRSVKVFGNQKVSVTGNLDESVTGNASKTVKGNDSLGVDGNGSTDIKGDDSVKVGKNLVIDAGDSVTIKTGDASISMKKDGTILIKGKDISIDGTDLVVKGSGKINIEATGDLTMKGSKIAQN